MRIVVITLIVLILAPATSTAADPAYEWTCVSEQIGRDFLELSYKDVVLVHETADTRVYRATKDGVTFEIEIDACTTEILAERPGN
jgi:hypothetical protein